MKRRDLLMFALLPLSAATLTPWSALAQAKYPERPIKLMVAFSAGGCPKDPRGAASTAAHASKPATISEREADKPDSVVVCDGTGRGTITA